VRSARSAAGRPLLQSLLSWSATWAAARTVRQPQTEDCDMTRSRLPAPTPRDGGQRMMLTLARFSCRRSPAPLAMAVAGLVRLVRFDSRVASQA
jgi:hypothetical protein